MTKCVCCHHELDAADMELARKLTIVTCRNPKCAVYNYTFCLNPRYNLLRLLEEGYISEADKAKAEAVSDE